MNAGGVTPPIVDGLALEWSSAAPTGPAQPVDVLFLHGICTGARIFAEHFLGAFAAAGFRAHAVSLRGHGASDGRARLATFTLADYVADLRAALSAIGRPTVVVGFSMGGAVAQAHLRAGGRPAGVVLMASVPPWGLGPSSLRLAATDPALFRELWLLNAFGVHAVDPKVVRRALFTDAVDDHAFAAFLADAQDESPLVGMELASGRPIAPLPVGLPPIAVVGGAVDRLVPADEAIATGLWYGVRTTMIPDLGHAMMLEPEWPRAAAPILDFCGRVAAARAVPIAA
jgi:pimeloyl-ACP methyl ester carboxylesterase